MGDGLERNELNRQEASETSGDKYQVVVLSDLNGCFVPVKLRPEGELGSVPWRGELERFPWVHGPAAESLLLRFACSGWPLRSSALQPSLLHG